MASPTHRVLHGIFGGAEDQATQQQQQFDRQRDQDIAMYQQELLRPPAEGESADDYEQRKQKIAGEIAKLRNLKGKDTPYHQLGTFLGKLGRAHIERQAGAPGQPSSPTGGESGGGGAPLQGETGGLPNAQQKSLPPLTNAAGQPHHVQSANAPPPDQGPPVVPPGQPPKSLPPVMAGQTQKILTKISRGLGSMMLAVEPALLGNPPQTTADLPPIDTTVIKGGTAGREQYGTSDIPGEAVVGQRSAITGQPITDEEAKGKTYRRVVRNGQVSYEQSTRSLAVSGIPRAFAPTSVAQAKQLAAQGQTYNDESGQPIDLNSIPQDMKLVPIYAGGKMFYQLASQNQTHLNVGGESYAMPEFNKTDTGGWVPLGPAQGPKVTTHQQITVNPATNQPMTTTLSGSSTPAPTGAVGAPAPGGKRALPGAPSSAGPQPAVTGQPKRASGAPARPPATAPAAKPVGMPTGMYNQQVQRVTPVRTAANQIFGDPANPSFQPLANYGDVMDYPDSVQRIGSAARLMLNDLANTEASRTGGLWTLIETSGGLPNALASAQSDQTRQALATLSPREQELLDAELDAYGTIMGLRSLTKGSAAKFSVASMERELPLPGVSAFDKFQFYDKLTRLGEEVMSGAKSINSDMLPERNAWAAQYDRLQHLKTEARPKTSRSLPGQPSSTASPAHVPPPEHDPAGLFH